MKVLASLVAVLVASVGVVILMLPTTVCSCLSNADNFAAGLGMNPRHRGAEAARMAFLAKVPPGSALQQVDELARLSGGIERRCKRHPRALDCTFDHQETILRGRTGYRVVIALDEADKVRDARFGRTEVLAAGPISLRNP